MLTADQINDQIMSEGWAIRNTTGTDDVGDWRIERDDELALFPNDQAVWRHIHEQAIAKSRPHRKALMFIAFNNATEWAAMRKEIPELGQHQKEYAFDVKMFATIRVTAMNQAHARGLLNDHLECASANFGSWPNGDPITGEASVDDDYPELIEIDGEAV